MAKYRCTICGAIMEEELEICPICGARADKFVLIQNNSKNWATEHTVGVAQDCKDKEIINSLKTCFSGECIEVGMYIAMARVAEREGYPEIGNAYRKIAMEEADHAGRLCELLGELLSNSTEENLKKRAEAKFYSNQDKYEISKISKIKGYDAIHDSIHEIARDEARHGKIFEGLLKRYFKNKENK